MVTFTHPATGRTAALASPLFIGCGDDTSVDVADPRVIDYIQEYVAKREAAPYVDILEDRIEFKTAPIVKPLFNRPLEKVLCEWDREFIAGLVTQGGVQLLLAVLAAAERAQCVWLVDMLAMYIADMVRVLSPDTIRQEVFGVGADDASLAPTDSLPEYAWVRSMVYRQPQDE